MTDLTALPWRTGGDSGRGLFAQVAREASAADILVGAMDTPELAEEACTAHNAEVIRRKMAARGVRVSGVSGFQVGDGNNQINHY